MLSYCIPLSGTVQFFAAHCNFLIERLNFVATQTISPARNDANREMHRSSGRKDNTTHNISVSTSVQFSVYSESRNSETKLKPSRKISKLKPYVTTNNLTNWLYKSAV